MTAAAGSGTCALRSAEKNHPFEVTFHPIVKLISSFILIIIGAIISIIGFGYVILANKSAGWPKAEGVVLESKVEASYVIKKGGTKNYTYLAMVAYEFEVGGSTFKGNRVAYGDHGTKNRKDAEAIIKRYPKDKKIQVSYMKEDPTKNVLDTGVKKKTWFISILGLCFLAFGVLKLLLR